MKIIKYDFREGGYITEKAPLQTDTFAVESSYENRYQGGNKIDNANISIANGIITVSIDFNNDHDLQSVQNISINQYNYGYFKYDDELYNMPLSKLSLEYKFINQ